MEGGRRRVTKKKDDCIHIKAAELGGEVHQFGFKMEVMEY